MTDPIDKIVLQKEETSGVSAKLNDYLQTAYRKIRSYFQHEEEIIPHEEIGPELEGLDTPSLSSHVAESHSASSSSPNQPRPRVPYQRHVHHPYCISGPKNPFVEDYERDWAIPTPPKSPYSYLD